MKKISLFLAIAVLFSSCASILNPKYQKVYISTSDRDAVVLIDSVPAIKKDGKYLFLRDWHPKKITLKKDGYVDQTTAIIQQRLSPWIILSVVPFGALYLLPALLDDGPKSRNYPKQVSVPKMIKIVKKDSIDKHIEFTDLVVEEDPVIPTGYYKRFIINSELYPIILNKIAKESGYLDTTKRVLKSSYQSNLKIKAHVSHDYNYFLKFRKNLPLGIYSIDLKVKWQVFDDYDQLLYSYTSNSKGALGFEENVEFAKEYALKVAFKNGFYDFMNSDSLQLLLKDNSAATQENNMEEFNIPIAKNYAQNLGDAIKASVTIKNKDGHGSGFFISENGYIITNYHVAVEKDIKVITHDDKEYDLEVVRVSKINDLALLKIDAKIEKPFKISNNHDISIAQEAYAVGTPSAEDLTQSISKGIISGVRKRDGGGKFIQTDASINGGNSGGAFVLKNGIVIGVVTSKLVGANIEGVGFVIPAYDILDKLKLKYTEK